MVPLSTDEDEKGASKDPSATQFFAIPVPKADRARPTDGPPTPPVSGPPGAGGPPPPPGGGPPPPAPMGGPPPPPPMGGPPPPPAGGAPPQAIGLGAAASGASAASQGGVSQTPFGGGGRVSGPSTTEHRVQSNRVYAIVIGMFFLVCSAIIITVLVGGGEEDEVPQNSNTTSTASSGSSTPVASAGGNKDTGFQPDPRPSRSRDRNRDRDRGTPKVKDTTPKDPAKPTAGKGKVVIRIRDSQMASKAELSCPGYRKRSSFRGSVATFTGVPGGTCEVIFFGATSYKKRNVKAGDYLTCSLAGESAKCSK